MGQKTITELQLVSAVTDAANIPLDDSIQSYRATAVQLRSYVMKPVISGTRSSPTAIVAGTGIVPGNYRYQKIYVQGSGGAVTISANPKIAAGNQDGDLLLVVGRSDSNTVTIANGNGVSQNGAITLRVDDSILYSWDTTNWVEVSRREKGLES